MTTYLLITSDKPTELKASADSKNWLPVAHKLAEIGMHWFCTSEEFIFTDDKQKSTRVKIGTPVELEGWEPEIVYQEAYLSGEGEIWKKCSIDRFNNIRHLDCKRQAYRLKRSEPVKECKHQYPRSIERTNRVCVLCRHAEETSEIESPIEAKTQDVPKNYCGDCNVMNTGCNYPECGGMPEPEPTKKETMFEAFQKAIDSMSDEELERQLAELGNIGVNGPTIDEYCNFLQSHYKSAPESHKTQESHEEQICRLLRETKRFIPSEATDLTIQIMDILTRRNP